MLLWATPIKHPFGSIHGRMSTGMGLLLFSLLCILSNEIQIRNGWSLLDNRDMFTAPLFSMILREL